MRGLTLLAITALATSISAKPIVEANGIEQEVVDVASTTYPYPSASLQSRASSKEVDASTHSEDPRHFRRLVSRWFGTASSSNEETKKWKHQLKEEKHKLKEAQHEKSHQEHEKEAERKHQEHSQIKHLEEQQHVEEEGLKEEHAQELADFKQSQKSSHLQHVTNETRETQDAVEIGLENGDFGKLKPRFASDVDGVSPNTDISDVENPDALPQHFGRAIEERDSQWAEDEKAYQDLIEAMTAKDVKIVLEKYAILDPECQEDLQFQPAELAPFDLYLMPPGFCHSCGKDESELVELDISKLLPVCVTTDPETCDKVYGDCDRDLLETFRAELTRFQRDGDTIFTNQDSIRTAKNLEFGLRPDLPKNACPSKPTSTRPLPTAKPTVVPGDKNYTYVGCVLEPEDTRALHHMYGSDSMTVDMCLGLCSQGNYAYAGVEYGR